MYISIILKFIKKFKKMIKLKIVYLTLPMLLLEGGQGLGHLESPCRHMETTPVPVVVIPTRYRNHHCIRYALCLLLPDGGRCLPTCSASADVDIGPIEVWRGSTLVLSQRRSQPICFHNQSSFAFLSCNRTIVFS